MQQSGKIKATGSRLKTDLSRFTNSWYKPGNIIVWALWHIVSALFFINPLAPFITLKKLLLQLFGAKIGKGFVIKTRVTIKFPWLLDIGDNVWLGENCWIE